MLPRLLRLFLFMGFLVGLLAAAPTNAQAQGELCFPETGQCTSGRFREYWEQNGGLAVFGYPITAPQDEFNADTGQSYLTQWFERNRFEMHPENGRPYDVLLGRLGNDRLVQQGRDWFSFPKASPSAPHYYAPTGHAVAEVFWSYWSSQGLDLGDVGVSERESLAMWGMPLSEPAMETNASGDTVLTQHFERARFEHHPRNPSPYNILLGLLGNEVRSQPTFEYPQHGQEIAYAGDWLFKVNMEGAIGYDWEFSQDGSVIIKQLSGDNFAINANSQEHGMFHPGFMAVKVTARLSGGRRSVPTTITIFLA